MRAALRSSIIALSLVFAGSALAAHGSAPASHASSGGGPVGITAPQYRVTPAYAKRVIKAVAADTVNQHGNGKWSVAFSVPAHGPIGGPTSNFTAQWQWGPGVHPMVAVPNVSGSFNWQKAPGAPKGAARVQVTSPTRN